MGLVMTAHAADQWVVKDGTLSVNDTVAKLEKNIADAPPSIMAKIDHGANAKKAGLELSESVLLILGAPKIGTPIMQSNILAGLDLPAKILVYSEDGKTKLAYTNPEALKERYNISGADGQIDGMGKALDAFTTGASK